MAVTVTYEVKLQTVETLSTNVPAAQAGASSITHSGYNHAQTQYNATPVGGIAVTECAYFQKDLSAGAGTIDLTALTGTNGRTIDGTGLKVQFFRVKALAANANPITLAEGASNGYALMGAAWSIILAPGQEFTLKGNEATPDVGATDKIIDLTGTGTQGLQVTIILG